MSTMPGGAPTRRRFIAIAAAAAGLPFAAVRSPRGNGALCTAGPVLRWGLRPRSCCTTRTPRMRAA